MARKNRSSFTPLPAAAPVSVEKKDDRVYADKFQSEFGRKVDDMGKALEGKGKTIAYALAALVVLGIVVFIFYSWNGRSNSAAQAALGKAIETSQAPVSDTPAPAGSTEKTFKTEKERSDAAIAEFQAVVDKFGGAAADKAKYFIAVTKLPVDRQGGIADLESISKESGDVGKMAKFALAQTRVYDGKLDEAAALYQELAGMSDPIIAKDTINFELAKVYEKQDKKQEAADIYFNIAKNASEAKDMDGKARAADHDGSERKGRARKDRSGAC